MNEKAQALFATGSAQGEMYRTLQYLSQRSDLPEILALSEDLL